tara:strand:+ start:37 stop:273 length:237 start_codon:yes stop_codon:yes gene_type:complete
MTIHEILPCGRRLRGLIYQRASLDDLRHEAAQDGMRTMRQDGIEKILSGHSDYSQLIQVVGVEEYKWGKIRNEWFAGS